MLIGAAAFMIALSGLGGAQTPWHETTEPMTVGFTLIRADNSGYSDPSLGGLDSTLRSVLRFTGYRAVSSGFSRAQEGTTFDLTLGLNANKRTVRLFCTVEHVSYNGSPATAQLRIKLSPVDSVDPTHVLEPALLSAGLTIPEQQKVVVGSGDYEGGGLALVVTWRKGLPGQKP
jgi:hypothetical protein